MNLKEQLDKHRLPDFAGAKIKGFFSWFLNRNILKGIF